MLFQSSQKCFQRSIHFLPRLFSKKSCFVHFRKSNLFPTPRRIFQFHKTRTHKQSCPISFQRPEINFFPIFTLHTSQRNKLFFLPPRDINPRLLFHFTNRCHQ